MRFQLSNEGPTPLLVRIEPSAAEFMLDPGDRYEFEGENVDTKPMLAIECEPGCITVSKPHGDFRMWNSLGEELNTRY